MAMKLDVIEMPSNFRTLLSAVRVKELRTCRHPGFYEAVVAIGDRTGIALMRKNVARLCIKCPDETMRGPAGWGCPVMQALCKELGEHAYWLLTAIEEDSDAALKRFEAEQERASRERTHELRQEERRRQERMRRTGW